MHYKKILMLKIKYENVNYMFQYTGMKIVVINKP